MPAFFRLTTIIILITLFTGAVSASSDYCTPATGFTVTIDHQENWFNFTIMSDTCPFCVDGGTGLVCASCLPVSPFPPTVLFTSNVTCGNIPFTVQFHDMSTGENILGYYWDFGDGNTSTDINPENTFSTPGMYTVSHAVINDNATAWNNKTGYIRAIPAYYSCDPVQAQSVIYSPQKVPTGIPLNPILPVFGIVITIALIAGKKH
ncbi:MAG: PKD domain-containing protein [Methanoregula sp.]|jgi:PKD repeat protein